MQYKKSKSRYPAYDHVSYNLEHKFGRTNVHLSFHTKLSSAQGGFWVGFRPEIEVRRDSDRVIALREEMRQVSMQYVCTKCHRQEWGPPGLGRPEGWDFIHMMDFCPECIANNSYKELMEFG